MTSRLAGGVARRYVRIALIVLVAVNLRPAVVAVGPLLGQIQGDLGLTGAQAGALTTLPLLFFGSFGLVAPLLRRTPRGETLLVASMGLLVVALLVRVLSNQVALFGGALLAGIAISIGNIAVPAIIKRDHPDGVTAVTALYTVAVTAGAAVSAGAVVPIEHATGSGWRLPLALLAAPATIAGLAWLARARRATAPVTSNGGSRMWRSPLAWQVTAFMGLQSLLAYVVTGWLPTIVHDRGLGEAAGGYALAVTSLIQAAGAFVVPLVERRLRDQRPLVATATVLCGLGFAGIAWAPIGWIWACVAVLGLGQGALFATALAFIGLRTPDAHVAARLSGMAQGIGYVIAAAGPLAVGAVHDATHGWSLPMALILVVVAVMVLPGLGAGRSRTIAIMPEPAARPSVRRSGAAQ